MCRLETWWYGFPGREVYDRRGVHEFGKCSDRRAILATFNYLTIISSKLSRL
jgi:hypothetical protein